MSGILGNKLLLHTYITFWVTSCWAGGTGQSYICSRINTKQNINKRSFFGHEENHRITPAAQGGAAGSVSHFYCLKTPPVP